jgi:acetyl esterase/lipase
MDPRTTSSKALGAALAALCVLAAGASPAYANVPSAVTKTNTLRIPALANAADGTLSTTLTYAATTATAVSSTGNTIWLAKGNTFKLTSCIAYHLDGNAPVSSCADRVVDTRFNSATIYTSAPSVALSDQPRPATERFAYFTATVQIVTQTGGTLVSSSWPDNGLQGAGLPVAAQGATSAQLPASSTITLTTPFAGVIDSGQPDSICRGSYSASNGSATPAGVSVSNPAFAGAPAYYEVGQPTGAYAGRPRRGTMLVIHGGGWTTNGPGAVQASRVEADRWRARGFLTVNITYRPCGQSTTDVAWFYDHTRAVLGSEKICATGISAGGYLALQLASRRPDLYCVVSKAGPTDLATIQGQPAYDSATRTLSQFLGGRWVHNLGAAAFGDENLTADSPAANASGSLRTSRVLQGFSADDGLVPWGQATELRDAMLAANPGAYADTVRMPAGSVSFGHGTVTQSALDDFNAREVALVAPIPA